MARSKTEAAGARARASKREEAPGQVPFLRQRVGSSVPEPRSAEGASTGRSAKSTAGGAAGQLTSKD